MDSNNLTPSIHLIHDAASLVRACLADLEGDPGRINYKGWQKIYGTVTATGATEEERLQSVTDAMSDRLTAVSLLAVTLAAKLANEREVSAVDAIASAEQKLVELLESAATA